MNSYRLSDLPEHCSAPHATIDTATRTAARTYTTFIHTLLVLLAAVGIAMPGDLQAQNDRCLTDSLRINTGWDHAANATHPIGTYTNYWRVVSDPSPGTTEPRPAAVINKFQSWANPLPNSQWISAYPSSQNDTNGVYVFEFCFCLGEKAVRPRLNLSVYADDSAVVYLNGNLVGSTAMGRPPYPFQVVTNMVAANPSHFKPGQKNCIRVELHNLSSVAMGLNIAGAVVSEGAGIQVPHCCDSTGSIIGMKFWDKNCNGKLDQGEPGLPNWTINLSNGWTTTTDALGNYYFTSVPAGAYVVTETNQPGWTQTYPVGGGGHTVSLAAGQVVSGINFGNCNIGQKDTCIRIAEQKIECITIPGTNLQGYKLTAWMKSFLANCGNTQTGTVTSVSPAGITVTPGTFSVSNTFQPVSFTISGPGAVAGATVTIVFRICCVDAAGVQHCCTDSIRIKLPECPQQHGCLRILEQKIECKPGPNGPTYQWCFSFLNQSNFVAYYFTVSPPAGISVTPNPILYASGVGIGNVSPWQCVTISGPNATPGSTHTFYVTLCDKTRRICCKDSIRITLDSCPKPKGCCDDFVKRFANLSNSASHNGNASVSGSLWAVGTGGSQIIGASATLVSVTVNNQPAWGSFVSGTMGLLGAGFVPPPPYSYPYSQDIGWGPTGPTTLSSASFNFNLKFQPMAPKTFKDVLRYCIRFRYTDANCVTCDTVICFTRIRYRLIILDDVIIFDRLHRGEAKKGDERGSSIQSAGTTPITGELVGTDSATLKINFPAYPEGTIRFIGLTVTPVDSTVEIADATTTAGGYDLFFLERGMLAYFEADAGNSVDFNLSYSGLGSRAALAHRIVFTYVVDGDTMSDEVEVTFRRGSAMGGDQVTPAISSLTDVRTFALHLRNANGSQQPVERLVIDTEDGVKIVAVGPTANGSQAVLQFGAAGSGQYAGEDLSAGTIQVLPGAGHGPIYLTLAGVANNTTTISFTTIDANGQAISQGQLTLSTPLSSVESGEDGSGSSAMLRQSYPNPASHSTTIGFNLPASDESVTLVVSDAGGREVARLIDGEMVNAGEHAVWFDTANLPSGTYYYTLRAGGKAETRSLQVVK